MMCFKYVDVCVHDGHVDNNSQLERYVYIYKTVFIIFIPLTPPNKNTRRSLPPPASFSSDPLASSGHPGGGHSHRASTPLFCLARPCLALHAPAKPCPAIRLGSARLGWDRLGSAGFCRVCASLATSPCEVLPCPALRCLTAGLDWARWSGMCIDRLLSGIERHIWAWPVVCYTSSSRTCTSARVRWC